MKRPAMEMLTRSRKEMALMANIQKMRSQRMGIGTYNDTRRRPRDLDSCAKNLLTGAADDATFEAGCCFCSIGYAGKESQPPRTVNDGHPVSPGAGHRFRDPCRVAGPAQLLGGARQAARAGGEGATCATKSRRCDTCTCPDRKSTRLNS